MSRWYWENHPGYGDPLRAVDGELDDVAPEERAALAREAAEEWQAEEAQTEAEDAARAERGTRDQEWRA